MKSSLLPWFYNYDVDYCLFFGPMVLCGMVEVFCHADQNGCVKIFTSLLTWATPMTQHHLRFTLRQLQLFVAAAKSGKISQAAVDCNVSQSAMTSAISELERTLNRLLFERSRNGVALTYEGNVFFQKALTLLEVAEDTARNPFQAAPHLAGTLEIAASYTVLGYFILPLIARFQKKHPQVKIIPVEYPRQTIETAIENERIEMAVAILSNIAQPHLFERQALANSRRQLWVSADHPLAEQSQVTLSEVAKFPYILPHVDEGDVAARQYWQIAGLSPVTMISTSSMEAVREMVALGFGVTILSDMVFRPWSLEGRRIRRVPLKSEIQPMEIGLIWKKSSTLGPIAQAFKDYLEVVSASPNKE